VRRRIDKELPPFCEKSMCMMSQDRRLDAATVLRPRRGTVARLVVVCVDRALHDIATFLGAIGKRQYARL
jgi:hypothetical protein